MDSLAEGGKILGKAEIYQDIAARTGGDIYIGVVGPVRTGKSTLIKKCLDLLVIPNILDQADLERARDEMPQSSSGKTIMTAEPKFVPDDAVGVVVGDGMKMNVKFVDCVGYTVPGAIGYEDENGPRMVNTPWYDHEIPFQEAAEFGTRKVITDHSTLGILVTTDGSFTDIPRGDYVPAERRVVEELKELGKPFAVVLNSSRPYAADIKKLRQQLEDDYAVPVVLVDCLHMSDDGLDSILKEVLYEFPLQEIAVNLPRWVRGLPGDHWLQESFRSLLKESVEPIEKVRDVEGMLESLQGYDLVQRIEMKEADLGTGRISLEVETPEHVYMEILSEVTGTQIKDHGDLVACLREFAFAKNEYDKLETALLQVKDTGYGMVPPVLTEMTMEQPEIIRQGGRFGVRLRASAPSIHMIKVDIKSEFTPIVGTEKQSEDLANYLTEEFEANPEKLWESNIFGKSLYDLVQDGITNKLGNMPPNAQDKLKETVEKIINEGSGGLIAIIL